LVVNKSVRESVPCTLAIEGARVAAAQARALVGPAPEATNETSPSNCTVVPLPVTVGDGIASVRFPKHSLTAITLRPATTKE
ncbi:hypothetical protein HQ576_02615, partial [bacterium]|nr:hypothetical protein [bacterium]